ncbi:hypothetical protein CK498_12265 [Halomonas salipaludis]|uniref:Uncharacterized protein n=1 Tax=Halomonas salipaludis TaxID=2032625 RepID=A0A2A2EW14_9GAMM|nr:hypothetical protein CK498_12265 [Halomonas salipaludis]
MGYHTLFSLNLTSFFIFPFIYQNKFNDDVASPLLSQLLKFSHNTRWNRFFYIIVVSLHIFDIFLLLLQFTKILIPSIK